MKLNLKLKKVSKAKIAEVKEAFINQNTFDKVKTYCVEVHNFDPALFDSGSFRDKFNGLKKMREERIEKDKQILNQNLNKETKKVLESAINESTKKLNININTIATTYLTSLATIANVIDKINKEYNSNRLDYIAVLNMLPKIEIANKITKEGLEVLKQFANGQGEIEIDGDGQVIVNANASSDNTGTGNYGTGMNMNGNYGMNMNGMNMNGMNAGMNTTGNYGMNMNGQTNQPLQIQIIKPFEKRN